MPDVVIIGGGPAGALAGVLLGRQGWDISLVEQHAFPRDKVCGECLSALAIDVLARHDLLRRFHGVELTHTTLYPAEGRAVRIPLAAPMLGVSRRALDAGLLEAAREAGVHVRQPARCEALQTVPGGVEVAVRDLAENHVEVLKARVVLVADGKGALLHVRRASTSDFGVKAHFRGVDLPRDSIALFGVRGHYGGVAPIEDSLFNAAFSVPGKMLQKHRGDLAAVFREVLTENRLFARAFQDAERVGAWLASPLPRFAVAATWPQRVIPIGNAAAALEPIGGEGMGLALRSAEMAVEALTRDPDAIEWARLRQQFDRLWRVRRAACRAAARVLSSPAIGSAAVELMGMNEGLARGVMKLIGKSARAC